MGPKIDGVGRVTVRATAERGTALSELKGANSQLHGKTKCVDFLRQSGYRIRSIH